jgi:hypothetical protein
VREWVTMDFKVVVSLWLGDSIVWKLTCYQLFGYLSLPLIGGFDRMETQLV